MKRKHKQDILVLKERVRDLTSEVRVLKRNIQDDTLRYVLTVLAVEQERRDKSD